MQSRPTASISLLPPIARHATPLDENGFVDWLIDASPGDKVAYFRGHLAHDRMPSANVLDQRSRAQLHAVANRVMVAAEQGLVIPVQKRIGREDCLYIAVKALPGRAKRLNGESLPPRHLGNGVSAVSPAQPVPASLAA